MPATQGRIIQTGSWIVNGMPAGLMFRETKKDQHFSDYDPFLLHTVRGHYMKPLEFKLNEHQKSLR